METIATLLAARQSKKDNYKVIYLYTDSWCVANGIAIWSGKWRLTDWKINGKDIWSKEAWKELDEIAKTVKIIVFHVVAHTKKQGKMYVNNDIVDKLAIAAIKLRREWKVAPTGDNKIKLQREWTKVEPIK